MRQNILNEPVPNVLYQLTQPMVVGIVAVFFFNLVDTWFISLLGTNSLAAAGFALPVTLLVMNLAIGVGIAASALIAQAVGAGDDTGARHAATGALLLGLLLGTALAVIGMLLNDTLFSLLGADAVVRAEIWHYMQFWWPGSVLMMAMMIQNSALRAVGNTRLPSRMMMAAALLNALLDPLLIFGLGPLPAMGIGGASLASALCWLLVIAVVLSHQLKTGALSWQGLVPGAVVSLWKRLLVLGIPAMITNMLVPVAAAILLLWVAPLGEEAVAGFGVGMRLEPFAIVVVLALTSTLPTFVAQNRAANQWPRVWQGLFLCYRFVLGWQLMICLALWLMAPWLAQLFSPEAKVQEYVIGFLRCLPLGYAGLGIVLCTNAALNSLQHTQLSMWLNGVRLFALYLPGAWLGLQLGAVVEEGYLGLLLGAATGNLVAGAGVWWMAQRLRNRGSLTLAGRRFVAQ